MLKIITSKSFINRLAFGFVRVTALVLLAGGMLVSAGGTIFFGAITTDQELNAITANSDAGEKNGVPHGYELDIAEKGITSLDFEFGSALRATKNGAATGEQALGFKVLSGLSGSATHYQIIKRGDSYTVIDATSLNYDTIITTWEFDNSMFIATDHDASTSNDGFLNTNNSSLLTSLKSLFDAADNTDAAAPTITTAHMVELLKLITSKFATLPWTVANPIHLQSIDSLTVKYIGSDTDANNRYRIVLLPNDLGNELSIVLTFGQLLPTSSNLRPSLGLKISVGSDDSVVAYYQIEQLTASADGVINYKIYHGSDSHTNFVDLTTAIDTDSAALNPIAKPVSDDAFQAVLRSVLLGEQADTDADFSRFFSAHLLNHSHIDLLGKTILHAFAKATIAASFQFGALIINGKDASPSIDQTALGLKVRQAGSALTDRYFQIIKQFNDATGAATYTIIDATADDVGTTWDTDTIGRWTFENTVDLNANLISEHELLPLLSSLLSAPVDGVIAQFGTAYEQTIWDAITLAFSSKTRAARRVGSGGMSAKPSVVINERSRSNSGISFDFNFNDGSTITIQFDLNQSFPPTSTDLGVTSRLSTINLKIRSVDGTAFAYYKLLKRATNTDVKYKIFDGSAVNVSFTDLADSALNSDTGQLITANSQFTLQMLNQVSTAVPTSFVESTDPIFLAGLASILLGTQAGADVRLVSTASVVQYSDLVAFKDLIDILFVQFDIARWTDFPEPLEVRQLSSDVFSLKIDFQPGLASTPFGIEFSKKGAGDDAEYAILAFNDSPHDYQYATSAATKIELGALLTAKGPNYTLSTEHLNTFWSLITDSFATLNYASNTGISVENTLNISWFVFFAGGFFNVMLLTFLILFATGYLQTTASSGSSIPTTPAVHDDPKKTTNNKEL